MTLTLNSALWLLLALAGVYGVVGLIYTFRAKMRELAQREARAAARVGRYRPNPDRAARRSKLA